MSHEIDTTTGRAAVMLVGTPAWHGLGQVITDAATSREAIEVAGLNWQVRQDPVWVDGVQGPRRADGFVANVRTDTGAVLGVVGDGYRVFQNDQAFAFMDDLVGDKLAMYQTAGSLRGGRKVWMLAAIPREYRAEPDDLIKPYVLLTNTHDGSGSLRMIPTSVRVVCQNTLNLALGTAGASEGLVIRHHGSLDARVNEARAKLGIVTARFDRFDEELHAMLAADLDVESANAYFDGLLPPAAGPRQRRHRREVMEAFVTNFDDDANSLTGIRHTAWAAYNAVSEWADHGRRFRGADAQQRQENRLNSIWFGSSHRLKQAAWASALELAGVN